MRRFIEGLTVIAYHRIEDSKGRPDQAMHLYRARNMVVSCETFRAHLTTITRRFHPVSLSDVARAAQGERTLPRKAILVSFDDGYRDVADVAAPLLARQQIPAVSFGRTPRNDKTQSFAPLDLVYQVLARAKGGPRADLVPQGLAREGLLSLPYAAQIDFAVGLAAGHGVDLDTLDAGDLYIMEQDSCALIAMGIEVGAHGKDHVRLTTLCDADLMRELDESRRWVERVAPTAAPAFSYPDAAVDERVAACAKRAGFSLGFILEAAQPLIEPRFALRRLVAQDEPGWLETIADRLEELA